MARPPLPLGHHGEISVAPKNDHWVARCRVRGLDGVTRKVEKHGRTRTAEVVPALVEVEVAVPHLKPAVR